MDFIHLILAARSRVDESALPAEIGVTPSAARSPLRRPPKRRRRSA
jgi:hypothetical protein